MIRFLREHVWSAIPAPNAKQRKIAAVAWPLALVLIGLLVYLHRRGDGEAIGMLPPALWVAAVVLAVLLLACGSRVGNSVYLGIMRTFATVGLVVSTVLLTAVFYLVVFPLGMLLRLMGKDLLGTRHPAQSAWHVRTGLPERRRFYRLF